MVIDVSEEHWRNASLPILVNFESPLNETVRRDLDQAKHSRPMDVADDGIEMEQSRKQP
jgi:hypothetical protein